MKKRTITIIKIALILSVGFILISCNSDKKVDSNTDNTNVTDKISNAGSSKDEDNIILFDNDNIKSYMAETVEDERLRNLIIKKLNLDNQEAKAIRYYYNSIDLNNDEKNEIFVVLVRENTGQLGSNNAFIFYNDDSGELKEMQEFANVYNPIIISDNKTNGYNDIIIPKNEKPMGEFLVLKHNGTLYSDMNDSEIIKSLDNISGTAIIANDMTKDVDEGKGLYLAK